MCCVYIYIYIYIYIYSIGLRELLERYSVYGQIAEDKKQFLVSPEIDLSVCVSGAENVAFG